MSVITLFTLPDCKDSLEMKKLLIEAGIDFEEQNISASKEFSLLTKKTPVMLLEKKRIISDVLTQLKLVNEILIEKRDA
ncbi:MAG: glutaredoxin domain-containing protein [Thermodesulfobacteriota bacterium]|nr:glutaredoxin domain-containing protein [Thermodesulfobacteriota bacterium]